MEYYSCDCGVELVKVEKDDEVNEIYFSIYSLGTGDNRIPFFLKLRYCWRILKTGRPYGDQIVLSFESAKRMGKYLIDLVGGSRG